ncbi:SUMF1/EgtB/PvdO family nonheme iron enzyme, partial [Pseudonocardia pini]|uniref:SUMF1/EgtB/PvdO family nonheme iron enzyme n=1 Tax=Pseudonocardia pini TaxID=2758030 RepID=UPI0015F0BBA8
MSECCAASGPVREPPAEVPLPAVGPSRTDLVPLHGGEFLMGSHEQRYPTDGDGPPRVVEVAPFRIAAHAVSNADFAEFVAVTGYLTTAEREGWSFVFGGL